MTAEIEEVTIAEGVTLTVIHLVEEVDVAEVTAVVEMMDAQKNWEKDFVSFARNVGIWNVIVRIWIVEGHPAIIIEKAAVEMIQEVDHLTETIIERVVETTPHEDLHQEEETLHLVAVIIQDRDLQWIVIEIQDHHLCEDTEERWLLECKIRILAWLIKSQI